MENLGAAPWLLSRYLLGRGRVTRQSYWLVNAWFSVAYAVLKTLNVMGGILGFPPVVLLLINVSIIVFSSIWFIVGCCVGAAGRMHDINKSAWNLLWGLVPVVGGIMLLYWLLFKAGTKGPNTYGDDPRQAFDVVYANESESSLKKKVWKNNITIIALSVLSLLIIFLGPVMLLKYTDVYHVAERHIREDAQIHEAIGNVQRLGFLPSGYVGANRGQEVAYLKLSAKGENGNVEIFLEMSKKLQQDWMVEKSTILGVGR